MLQTGELPAGAKEVELVELVRGLYPSPLARAEALRTAGGEDIADVASSGCPGVSASGPARDRARRPPGAARARRVDRGLGRRHPSFWSGGGRVRLQQALATVCPHRLEEAEEVATRVVVIARGRVVADGSADEVKAATDERGAVSFRAMTRGGAPVP
jgi:ABC-2 type transport system ATP-binding protein